MNTNSDSGAADMVGKLIEVALIAVVTYVVPKILDRIARVFGDE